MDSSEQMGQAEKEPQRKDNRRWGDKFQGG